MDDLFSAFLLFCGFCLAASTLEAWLPLVGRLILAAILPAMQTWTTWRNSTRPNDWIDELFSH